MSNVGRKAQAASGSFVGGAVRGNDRMPLAKARHFSQMQRQRAVNPSRVSYPAMHPTTKRTVVTRLRRIEGQVGGLLRMVEDGRYCLDILTQINAVRAALHKVEAEILRDHLSHCVAHAFTSGGAVEQRHEIEELVETIGRMRKG